jgi:excisionase family DNA binding protein
MRMTTFMTEEIFTLREVAGYLKVTERTIYRLVAEKQIPAFKVGGAWRFRRVEFDAWIKHRTIADANAEPVQVAIPKARSNKARR